MPTPLQTAQQRARQSYLGSLGDSYSRISSARSSDHRKDSDNDSLLSNSLNEMWSKSGDSITLSVASPPSTELHATRAEFVMNGTSSLDSKYFAL